MYLDNLAGTGYTYSPYHVGQSRATGTGAAQGSSPSATTTDSASSSPVSLSEAAQALQAQNGSVGGPSSGRGATDFAQEQQLLTTLTDKSLAALGIVSTADEAATQVNFDSLSYQVSSSSTASVAQQGQQSSAQLGESQDATFVGEGSIVTADGTQYQFQIELQVDQSEQVAASSGSNASANASDVGGVGTQQQPSNLLAQLVNAIGQASTSSGALGANAEGSFLNGNNTTSAFNSTTGQAGQSASQSTGINWDAIFKQTASLFDLLDAMAAPSQAAAATAA